MFFFLLIYIHTISKYLTFHLYLLLYILFTKPLDIYMKRRENNDWENVLNVMYTKSLEFGPKRISQKWIFCSHKVEITKRTPNLLEFGPKHIQVFSLLFCFYENELFIPRSIVIKSQIYELSNGLKCVRIRFNKVKKCR